jgi:hypothetical protein
MQKKTYLLTVYPCNRLTQSSFQIFVEEVSANYSDLFYRNEVHYLSSGGVLQCSVTLRGETCRLLENYPIKFPELHDEKWNNDLRFLHDITHVINEVNLQLQIRTKLNESTYNNGTN